MLKLTLMALVAVTFSLPLSPAHSTVSPEIIPAIAKLELQFQQSRRRFFPDDIPDFGKYLGTGNGLISGDLNGSVGWDLYEDWQLDSFHPTLFKGVITFDEKQAEFTMQGVFTPYIEDDTRYWRFSGFIHLHDQQISDRHFGYQVLPVHGRVKEGVWSHEYYIYKPW